VRYESPLISDFPVFYFSIKKLKIPTFYDIFIIWRLKMKNEFVQRSKDILGGVPVFTGTRVPIQNMIDYLEAGDSIDAFLEDFPTVKREQAISLQILVMKP
jgi:uncharacterized protein (DUF433 family)